MEKIIIPNEPTEVTEIREKILSSFDKLVFIEEGHQYFLDGKSLPSVSSITHKFSEPFDEEMQAEKYAIKHGETADYWLDQWHYNSLRATTTGTAVHLFGETMAYVKNKLYDLVPDGCKYQFIKDKKWLVPTRPKEEAIVKFYDELDTNLHFVLAETKVYTGLNKELTNLNQDYCGTFDLLMYYKHPTDDSKSGLVIMDYKTNKALYTDFSRAKGKMLYPPFDDLYDESLGLYTLQLSCYQIPLEDIGLKVIARRIIHLKDDGTYELIPVPNVTDKLRKVL